MTDTWLMLEKRVGVLLLSLETGDGGGGEEGKRSATGEQINIIMGTGIYCKKIMMCT